MKRLLIFVMASMLFSSHSLLFAENKEEVEEIRDEILIKGDYYTAYKIGKAYMEVLDLNEEDEMLLNFYTGFASTFRCVPVSEQLEYMDKASELSIRLYGENNRNLGLINMVYSLIYTETDTEKSIDYADRSLNILLDACGEESWEVGYAKIRLGYQKVFTKDVQNGFDILQEGIDILDYLGMQQTWMYANALAMRGAANLLLKENNAAIDDVYESVNVLDVLGMETPQAYFFSYAASIFVWMQVGFAADAIEVSQQLMTLMEEYELSETVNYAAVIVNLATSYYLNNEHKKAKRFFIKAKEVYEKIEGATESPNYKNVIKWIDFIK